MNGILWLDWARLQHEEGPCSGLSQLASRSARAGRLLSTLDTCSRTYHLDASAGDHFRGADPSKECRASGGVWPPPSMWSNCALAVALLISRDPPKCYKWVPPPDAAPLPSARPSTLVGGSRRAVVLRASAACTPPMFSLN